MENEELLKKYLVWREGEERLKKYLRLMICLNEHKEPVGFGSVEISFPWLAPTRPEVAYEIGPWNLMG